MAKFIEITGRDGNKALINTAWIESVYTELSTETAIIYIAFNNQGYFEQDYIHCQESYEEVKAMILGKDEGK